MSINTISILGSGWLGLPLATQLYKQGFHVKTSTRHRERFSEISTAGASAFYVDIDQISDIHIVYQFHLGLSKSQS